MKPIITKEYAAIHYWIKSRYGKATCCSNPECKGNSTMFEWAMIHECGYDYNINNFKELCRSCHAIYDMTEERKDKISKSHTGKKHSEETKRKISEGMLQKRKERENKKRESK